MHTLWQCPSTRDVWSLGNRALQKSAICEGNLGEVFENLFQRCSQEEMVQVAGLARRIWLRRNDVVFGGELASPHSLIKMTDQAITDFKLAQETKARPLEVLDGSCHTSWKPQLRSG